MVLKSYKVWNEKHYKYYNFKPKYISSISNIGFDGEKIVCIKNTNQRVLIAQSKGTFLEKSNYCHKRHAFLFVESNHGVL